MTGTELTKKARNKVGAASHPEKEGCGQWEDAHGIGRSGSGAEERTAFALGLPEIPT